MALSRNRRCAVPAGTFGFSVTVDLGIDLGFVSMGSGALRSAACLLPRWAAPRYLEEWRGELYDLRAEGARWRRRAGYVTAVVLYATPVLAVSLRLRRTRVVD